MSLREGSYWDKVLAKRVGRRRIIAATGATATGAAFLAACGGEDDDDDSSDGSSSSGGPSQPRAESTNAPQPTPAGGPKTGGTWRVAHGGEPVGLDPMGHVSGVTKSFTGAVYSRLFTFKTGPGSARISFEAIPDAAESMETNDPVTYVVKLNPNVKYTAPISRQLTTADVKFSHERLLGLTGDIAPGPDADVVALIDSIETPDDTTLIFHLNRAHAAFPAVLADARALQIMPVETGTAFDPSQGMIGSGPWIFEDYQVGSVATYNRNPDWHSPYSEVFGTGRPYMDKLEQYIISDTATQVNQFLGGNLGSIGLNAENIQRALDEYGDELQLDANAGENVLQLIFAADAMSNTPVGDERVRRAISMSYDRDLMLDAAAGYKDYTDMGLTVSYNWNTVLPNAYEDYWLDPKTAMSPANAAYFQYNPEEAAKLMAAAGVGDGFDMEFNWIQGRYGPAYEIVCESLIELLSEIKIGLTSKLHDATAFTSQVLPGQFTGSAAVYYTLGEPTNFVTAQYLPEAARNVPKINDSVINDLETKLVAGATLEERQEHFHAIQERAAEMMYFIPLPQGTGFTGVLPEVRNFIGYRSHGHGLWSEMTHVHWLDV